MATLVAKEEGKTLWSEKLGRISAIKIASNGRYGAVLVGDRRGSHEIEASAGSQNTIHIIRLSDGKVFQTILPFQGEKRLEWADKAWQNLDMTMTNDTLIVSGTLFVAVIHPEKVPFRKKFPLPAELR